jgi:hypothetical protein
MIVALLWHAPMNSVTSLCSGAKASNSGGAGFYGRHARHRVSYVNYDLLWLRFSYTDGARTSMKVT